VNDAFVAQFVRDHLGGKTDYQVQLFILASLELWFRVFIDSPSLEHPSGSVDTPIDQGELERAPRTAPTL
jgi:asparagine synthase (glutamine-hydrolysing)